MEYALKYFKISLAVLLPHVQCILNTEHEVYQKAMEEWYPTLKHPLYTPPTYVFGTVFTLLYSVVGYASYLVYSAGGGFNAVTLWPLALYGAQLGLNWMWCPVFFKHRKIGLSAVLTIGTFGIVCSTIAAFYKVSTTAGHFMIPYVGWQAFLFVYVIDLWRLNRGSNSGKNK